MLVIKDLWLLNLDWNCKIIRICVLMMPSFNIVQLIFFQIYPFRYLRAIFLIISVTTCCINVSNKSFFWGVLMNIAKVKFNSIICSYQKPVICTSRSFKVTLYNLTVCNATICDFRFKIHLYWILGIYII